MASSSSQQQSLGVLQNFYCHSCYASFQSKEAQCIKCNSEFVEEVEKPTQSLEQHDSDIILTTPSVRPREVHESDDEVHLSGRSTRRRRDNSSRNEGADLGETLGQYLVQLIQAREQLEDTENYTLPVIPPPPQFMDLLFRAPRIERLNPQTSSFAGVLHNFVARLVEQLENSEGAPPADQGKIDELPSITLTQELIDKESECSICKEPYTVGDNGRQLPCKHFFHDVCILQWLKLRDTCPTCRFSLNQGKVLS